MLGHLIRKEILDHILSLRFMILSAIGALIIWLSLYDGYACYRDNLMDYRLAQATTEDRLRQIAVADNWSELTARGYLVHKPPTPMSIFIRGLEPFLGRSVNVTTIHRLEQSPAAMEPILGFFLPLDMGQVVQVVLSLFVLLLTYDAVSGEKEGGTLRLTSSFSVPRDRLLLGKFLGVLIPTLVAFGIPLLLGIGGVLLASEVHLNGSDMIRLGLILMTFVVYLALFTCAGLLASCLTHRAATSFALLLVFWVGTVAVLPRLSLIVADGFRPAPSIHQLQTEKAAIANAMGRKQSDMWGEWWKKHAIPGVNQQPPEILEASYLYVSQLRRELGVEGGKQSARLDEAFHNRYNARLDLAVFLARFSPAFALNNATVRLAGTGIDRQRRFLAAFEVFREGHGNWGVATKDRDRLRERHPAKYGAYKWNVSDMPRFGYRETWPEEEVLVALIDVGVLALWGLAFFIGAYVAMLRYDLR